MKGRLDSRSSISSSLYVIDAVALTVWPRIAFLLARLMCQDKVLTDSGGPLSI